MSGPVPPTAPRCGGTPSSFLTGLLVGAGLVAAAAFVFHEREQRQLALEAEHQAAEVAPAQAAVAFLENGLAQAAPAAGRTVPAKAGEVEQVKALGDATVDDLRQGRLLSAYRLTTLEFRAKTTKEAFDEMVRKANNVRNIYPNVGSRDTKVRKATDGPGYEYYCTSSGPNFSGVVNFAFVFVPLDGDWRIDQFHVDQDK